MFTIYIILINYTLQCVVNVGVFWNHHFGIITKNPKGVVNRLEYGLLQLIL